MITTSLESELILDDEFNTITFKDHLKDALADQDSSCCPQNETQYEQLLYVHVQGGAADEK